jgi:hypothetical protein
MSSFRRKLEIRRERSVLQFSFRGASYHAGYCFFADGTLAELFVFAAKPNSEQDIAPHASALLRVFALDGLPLQTIRRALAEESGEAAGVLCHALDLIEAEMRAR